MGYFAIVYGRIECTPDPCNSIDSLPFRGSVYHHNRCAVQSIPDTDDQYPYLTRHMFSVAAPKLGNSFDRGDIPQIVHFGASLKVGFEESEFSELWLKKFEQHLLQNVVWRTALVHFEHDILGACTVRYDADSDSLQSVLYEFQLVGARVEAKLAWERSPALVVSAFRTQR